MIAGRKRVSAKRVLIVDDSASVRRQVVQALSGAGFEVVEADNGVTGTQMIDEDPSLAAVICDIHMPCMDGLEMLSFVKSKARHRALSVLMLTAEVQPDMILKAKERGARGWLVKPFAPSQLVSAIRKLTAD
jgi:two-component system, chemotaxis family, chemotaxis protein CheY